MLANRLAEGFPHLGIGKRILQRRVGDTNPARRHIDPPQFKPRRGMAKPLALLAADQAIRRHRVILEHQLAGIDALVADLLQLSPDPEAVAFLGEEHRHAAMARLGVGVGLDQQREARTLDAVRDPCLGAVDHVAVAAFHRAGADRLQIGAAIGFCKRQPTAHLAAGEFGQEVFFLVLGAEALNRRGHDQVRIENPGERHPDLGDHRDDPRIGRRRQPETAEFRRDGGAEQPQRLHLLDHLGGIDVVVLERHHVRLDVALEPLLDTVEDQPFVGLGDRLGHCPASCAAAILSSTPWPRLGTRTWRL